MEARVDSQNAHKPRFISMKHTFQSLANNFIRLTEFSSNRKSSASFSKVDGAPRYIKPMDQRTFLAN
jgi:hypothetical protein